MKMPAAIAEQTPNETGRIECPGGLPRPTGRHAIDSAPTVSTLQRQLSASPPEPLPQASRLTVRAMPLPHAADTTAPDPVDPMALLAAVPSDRSHVFWMGPEDEDHGEVLLGVGSALRLVAEPDRTPAAAVVALGEKVRRVFEERLEPAPEGTPLRALFTVAFDPAHAFGDGAERERWRGFDAVEALIPEILVRYPHGGRTLPEEPPTALLVGTEKRVAELTTELEELVRRARPPRTAPVPGDLEVEWAAGRHHRAVEAALKALSEPALSKVVLAHAVEVRRQRPFVPAPLLSALRKTYPGCFLFSVRAGGGAPDGTPLFLGASPERLARVDRVPLVPVDTLPKVAAPGDGGPLLPARRERGWGGDEGSDVPADGPEGAGPERLADGLRVLSGALAGSAPRGRTEELDRRLGAALLASAKDREEHRIVEEMIAAALGPLCSRLRRGGEPMLERLDNVQHLYTPVTGVLHPGRTLFDAVAALHPTPAVGGMPQDRAMAAIRGLEATPRGLYAGVVGWIDPDGHGDSAVAIRSALVAGTRARIYAGGGIVPTSDPAVEVEEIRIKAAAILGAMKAPGD